MKHFCILLAALSISTVGNTAIVTIGILPAVSEDFRYTMSSVCDYAFGGYAGPFAGCIGSWVLDQSDKEILQDLEATGTLGIVRESIRTGQQGNLEIPVSDNLVEKFGNLKVKRALESYTAGISSIAPSAE
ncbi:MAG: hypothetical protein AABY64_14990 [Bdellovibrionota bacterium]